jgi:4-diphosphocytidyl-2-C-methyl-D-erythritol kinase
MLRVVGRRANGYHELQTVFQIIDRSDLLYYRVRSDGLVTREGGPAGVSQAQDLTVRAATLLQNHSGCGLGVDIRIDKRLPMGGGLGGGSSDAATTLVALNRLWALGLVEDELARLALSLGADVPVFVRGHSAWGEGVGEHLQPLALPEPWFLVLTPPCHVSTASVFADNELTRNSPRITISDFLAGDAVNDCLPVVRKKHPPVARALDWLNRHGRGRLTGTGACVFAGYDNPTLAREVLGRVPEGLQAFVARGLNRSPLIDVLSARQ